MDDRDHLFISYASEDHAFARWLALRLTAEGYKVWIDQFKLLGGESWPRNVDIAIKTRTFRVLGLLSRNSIAKPNPLKERTLALAIAKQPGRQGFLIPLNVDGLAPTELDWLTSDITFISFSASWANGIWQLIKLLDREGCPKSVANGRIVANDVDSASEIVLSRPDLLTSNAQRFLQVPTQLTTFVVDSKFDKSDAADAMRDWPFYTISPRRLVSFFPPDSVLSSWLHVGSVRTTDWRKMPTVEGVKSTNIVSALLRAAIESRCRLRGLIWSAGAEAHFFQGPLGQDISVQLPSGATTRVQHSGQRTYFRIGQPKTPYRYRLAAKPSVERDLLAEFCLTWRLRFHFTDTEDVPLPSALQQSRRKHLTRTWFNYHWFVRQLAVTQFLAGNDGTIRVGPDGPQQVILDCSLLSFVAPKTIDEDKLEQLEEISDDIPVIEEDDDDVNDETTDEK